MSSADTLGAEMSEAEEKRPGSVGEGSGGERNLLAVVREEEETDRRGRQREAIPGKAMSPRRCTRRPAVHIICLVPAKSTWACLVGGEEAFDKALA